MYAETESDRDVGMLVGLTGASVTVGFMVELVEGFFCKTKNPKRQMARTAVTINIFLYFFMCYGHPAGSEKGTFSFSPLYPKCK